MDRIKPINLLAAVTAVQAHIARCEWQQRMTDCVVEFVTNHWPKRPDVRTKRKVEEMLKAQGFGIWYVSIDASYSGAGTRDLRIHMDDRSTVMYYNVRERADGGVDRDYLLLQHRMYATTAAQLREKLKDIPAKVEEFNHHLSALVELTEFAKDECHHPHQLYPLSQIFYTYELKQY